MSGGGKSITPEALVEAAASNYWIGVDTDTNAALVNVVATLLDIDLDRAERLIVTHPINERSNQS